MQSSTLSMIGLRYTDKKRTDPGMWCIGGTIPGSRYYSRHVALQIKAQVMGSPLPVYTGERYVGSSSR